MTSDNTSKNLNSKNSSNKYLVALERHLAFLRQSAENPKLEDVADYLGISAGKSGKEKRRALIDSHFPPSKQTPPSKKILRQIYLGFNIPLSEFDLSKDDLFTDWSPKITTLKELVPLAHSNKTQGAKDKFINRYSNTLEIYMRKAERTFQVYDYLGKEALSFFDDTLEHYKEANQKFFKTIEEQLKYKPDLQYLRILALPISGEELKNREDLLSSFQEGILISSYDKFAHICRCMNQFKDRVKFYILPFPSRAYNYAVIDSKVIFSEYVRYNKSGRIIPDLLFVEELELSKKENIATLLWTYENEMETLSGKKERLISADNKKLFFAAKRKHKALKSEIKALQEKIKNLTPMEPSEYLRCDNLLDRLKIQKDDMSKKISLMEEIFETNL